ncbi:MAG: YdcF family protein [Chloroflexota bacterium]|nr:YdcF family protein [Chloroflexota bacterium]
MRRGKEYLLRAWRRVGRLLAWLLVSAGASLLLWSVLALLYVATDNVSDYAVPSDVIIVLGCPSYERNVVSATFSACVQARARHAARLYHRGLAAHIIPTGGFTGPPPSEAEALSQVMQGDGVPPSAITLEEQARNTVQNIQFSRAIMRARGWKTAIIVTEPHHIKRAAVIARDAGLDITVSPVTDSPGWNTPDARHQNLLGDARNLMLYQWSRLRRGPP